ncbi:iron complex outermembrane recepter protein [Pseudoalteromonas sp. BSi20652]|uniref:TonB-dependent siderophore receptor n=1 Tax=Pseudoalteromonas sp. BSi20652 TaxID=388384 RepID=UPI000231B570|nr:TonB-dependent receptor [Pseudoalteromonas sp. BSi20652]GAA60286.1 iron complex outermembrane recepter protein [Pseudoalteromonas sp. BSi20652]
MFNSRYLPFSITAALSVFSHLSYAQQNENIETIEVTGRAQQFYLETQSKIGTKTNLDLIKLPQSAQVLTEQLIIDQAARDITDLYRSIAGVSEYSYSGVTFRGFRDDENVFYDGVRGDPYSGFGVPQLFNVERVEVLKGPASALYGGGEPGGMINYVTKKPSYTQKRELKLTLGNFNTRGASLDMTGGLSDTMAYRLGGFYEKQDSFRNNADSANTELTGGLLFDLSDSTTLTTSIDYIKQDLGGNRLRGVPVDDNGNFLIDPSYNANESFDYQDMEAWVLQAELSHYFSDDFSLSTTFRYMDNERDQAYHESQSWVDVNGDGVANIDDETIKREYRKQFRANKEASVTTDFVYNFGQGQLAHQFLFGGDYHTVDTEYDYLRARYEADGVANLNIFNLNYGETDPSTYNLTDMNRDGVDTDRFGIYVQDVISIGEQWAVIAGLRYDYFKELNKETGFSYSDNGVTPRVAVTYQPVENTSVYINYSESFNPTSSGDQEDVVGEGNLDPETGKQTELGMKNQWLDGKIMSTFAVYQINKQNVVMSNPDDTGVGDGITALLNIGEVESRGFETTLVGDLSEYWTITANYAYNDTVVVEGALGEIFSDTFGDGSRFANAPRHQAGLWSRFWLDSINSSIAFGANYVSEQVSSDGQKVKPFTVFDMSWTSRFDDVLLSVNINNLFDKEYAVSGFSERNGHFPGSPREIVGQITYKF